MSVSHPPSVVSPRLRRAAVIATAIDVLLAFNIFGYLFLGSIGSPDQFGLSAVEIVLYVPIVIPFVLAALIVPPILTATRLESRPSAWFLIGLVGVGCPISAAQVGWYSLQAGRSHDRDLSAVRSLAGLHGAEGGVRFELRPVAGTDRIDLLVTVEDGAAAPELPPERWLYVLCDSKDVQAQFGNDASRLNMYGGPVSHVRETPDGAVFELQGDSAHGAAHDPDFPDPYCSFVVDDSSSGVPRTIFHAQLQR